MPLPELHGQQHHVVYLPASGHHLIHGTAGSGKTVMAILRGISLANRRTVNSGETLLLTHDNSLVNYLRYLAQDEASELQIETYFKFARGYLNHRGLMESNSISANIAVDVASAVGKVSRDYPSALFSSRHSDFFVDEVKWILGMGLESESKYLAIERGGRGIPLQQGDRRLMWLIYEEMLGSLKESGKRYYWEKIATEVRSALADDLTPRKYRHIVVDEAQDFSPEIIRSLSEAIQPGGSLTVFMDESQQVFGQRTPWKTWGLEVSPSEVHRFRENYRNTPDIARLALAMANLPHFKDIPDIVMPNTPPMAAGARPTLFITNSREKELAVVKRQAQALKRSTRIAILARTRVAVDELVAAIPEAKRIHKWMPRWDDEPGIHVGTFHSAKGLEFDFVIIPFASKGLMPRQESVDAFGLADAMSRESRLLYVGVTRARTEVLITSTGVLTDLFPASNSGLWQVVEDL